MVARPLTRSSWQVYRAFSHTPVPGMPPIDKPPQGAKYDIVFIGGGSGGSAGSVCLIRHVRRVYANCSIPSAAPRSTAQTQLS